jgi:hypothetical protein
MQPGALKLFRERLTAAGLLKEAPAFSAASGALSIAIYKEEIEKMFRTAKLGGFQLLDLHDYSGQNTSLVGILDALWNTKGLVAPAQWRRFCAPSVVVARLQKFVFAPSDTFDVPVEVAHYGRVNAAAVRTRWSLLDSAGGGGWRRSRRASRCPHGSEHGARKRQTRSQSSSVTRAIPLRSRSRRAGDQ